MDCYNLSNVLTDLLICALCQGVALSADFFMSLVVRYMPMIYYTFRHFDALAAGSIFRGVAEHQCSHGRIRSQDAARTSCR